MASFGRVANASLKSKIIDIIRFKGKLTVADYMRIVLTNPESGFYMNNDVFGIKGHFTTSPEVSQVFGEILGVWIMQEWLRFGKPKPLRLVEFGPGRGTLLSDITRTLGSFKETHDSIELNLIEVSPHLKGTQEKTLASLPKNLIKNVSWHPAIESLDDHKDGFSAYIAHEFLDALPIHKFVKTKENTWRELVIDYNSNQELIFSISRAPSLTTKFLVPQDFDGDHYECCPEGALIMTKICDKLNKSGKGCALVCDYGFEDPESEKWDTAHNPDTSRIHTTRSNRDTFRAFRNHQPHQPLKDPGEADLTADVDFGYLKQQLNDKALIFGPVSQSHFLMSCGLGARLSVLLDNANETDKAELISGAEMLTGQMGLRYKFLSLFPKGVDDLFKGNPPAGFHSNHRA